MHDDLEHVRAMSDMRQASHERELPPEPSAAPPPPRRSPPPPREVVRIGYLHGLFVLARAIGLIGHALDQQRLRQPLYRHPWDDVLYTK